MNFQTLVNIRERIRNLPDTLIIMGLILFILGLFFFGLKSSVDKYKMRNDELKQAYYKSGKEIGYEKGMTELEIYKHSAIKAGVARYEIVDEMNGETEFKWILPVVTNVIYECGSCSNTFKEW